METLLSTLNPYSLTIYSDASRMSESSLCGLGIVVGLTNSRILIAGSMSAFVESSLYGKAQAMMLAFSFSRIVEVWFSISIMMMIEYLGD